MSRSCYRDGRRRSDAGATAVEYALLLSFIAAVIIGAVAVLGGDVVALFASVPDF